MTDARASDTDACLGGYLAVSEDLKECQWFSIEVKESWAPWLNMKGGSPKRVIAALELMATLIAVKLSGRKVPGNLRARMRAYTDNRGNAFALVRGMSKKYPLTILLMDLSEEMKLLDFKLDLGETRMRKQMLCPMETGRGLTKTRGLK